MAESDLIFVDKDPMTGQPTMSAAEFRMAFEGLQEGVFEPTDLRVTAGPTSGGAPTVDVAQGRVLIDAGITGGYQPGRRYGGFLDTPKNSADFEGGGIPANGSINPRLDAVLAQVWDDTMDASGMRKWRLVYWSGTASAGATLGGLGQGSFPNQSSVLLAEVLVPGGNPSVIPAANIRDHRPWAKGLRVYVRVRGVANFTVGTSYTEIPNLSRRVECSGKPVRMSLQVLHSNSSASVLDKFVPWIDGAPAEVIEQGMPTVANHPMFSNIAYETVPAQGSHLLSWGCAASAGTMTVYTDSAHLLQASYEELQPSANNS